MKICEPQNREINVSRKFHEKRYINFSEHENLKVGQAVLCLQVRFRFLRLVGIDASLSNAKLLFLNYLISLSNADAFLVHCYWFIIFLIILKKTV